MIGQDGLIAASSLGGVEYRAIGGLAVAAHWSVRATKDLDIVPDPAPGNLQRLATVLRVASSDLTRQPEQQCRDGDETRLRC
jgi:hypothetical protein